MMRPSARFCTGAGGGGGGGGGGGAAVVVALAAAVAIAGSGGFSTTCVTQYESSGLVITSILSARVIELSLQASSSDADCLFTK